MNLDTKPHREGVRLAMLWEQYQDAKTAVGEIGLDGRFLRVNQSFCSLLGYREQELLELRVRDVTHPDDRVQSVGIVDRALRRFEQSQQVFKRYVHRDGHIVFALLQTTLKRDLDGEPTHFLSFVEDVSQRVQEEALPRAMALRMQMLQEQERHQIARELHDELSQVLTALKLEVRWLQGKVPSNAEERLSHLGVLVDSIVASAGRLWLGLRPPILDELGLVPALDWLLQETCGRSEIETSFVFPEQSLRLDSESRLALFRIAQEALTNCVRHAQASRVRLELEQGDQDVCLTVLDDGIGIDWTTPNPACSVGLAGIRERVFLLAGTFSLGANSPRGTILRACLPVASSILDERRVPPHWA